MQEREGAGLREPALEPLRDNDESLPRSTPPPYSIPESRSALKGAWVSVAVKVCQPKVAGSASKVRGASSAAGSRPSFSHCWGGSVPSSSSQVISSCRPLLSSVRSSARDVQPAARQAAPAAPPSRTHLRAVDPADLPRGQPRTRQGAAEAQAGAERLPRYLGCASSSSKAHRPVKSRELIAPGPIFPPISSSDFVRSLVDHLARSGFTPFITPKEPNPHERDQGARKPRPPLPRRHRRRGRGGRALRRSRSFAQVKPNASPTTSPSGDEIGNVVVLRPAVGLAAA